MKSVVEHQPTAEDDVDRITHRITTDRVLKLTSYLLRALIQVTETFTKDDESKFLQCIHFAFPDAWLREVELDPEARIEADDDGLDEGFEDDYPEQEDPNPGEDSELLDGVLPAADEVIYGRMDADEARDFVEMLDQLLGEVASGERFLKVKYLAAIHAVRCQLLTPQGEEAPEDQSQDAVMISRWLIEEVDRFTNGRGMARDLRNAFPDLLSVTDADRSAGDLLLGKMSLQERETLVEALNDVLDADLSHSESGGIIEAARCLLG